MVQNWKESYHKRVKPILFIQMVGSVLIFIILANNFFNEFSMVQFKLLFWLLAVVSFSLALEDMLSKKQRSVYMLKFSTTVIYLIFPIFLLH
ncbi:hypothetical protein [Sutcliffiella deserti]|uniref:hypothetical protein n=1 Tax=Sutcliffiella deserti TaxID=2875501 RepID=UPI001CBC4983|nr:hypothetical protein [Sutcliffiella deserti]